MEERYTHVVLWREDAEGRIVVLAQVPVSGPSRSYHAPHPYWVYAAQGAPGIGDDPEAYAREAARGLAEGFTPGR